MKKGKEEVGRGAAETTTAEGEARGGEGVFGRGLIEGGERPLELNARILAVGF